MVEDEILWRKKSCGRRPSMEDELRWKMTFSRRRALVEDYLRWNTAFIGRRPLVEDDLRWKMTFSGRQPLVEDSLRIAFLNSAAQSADLYSKGCKNDKNFKDHMITHTYSKSECDIWGTNTHTMRPHCECESIS